MIDKVREISMSIATFMPFLIRTFSGGLTIGNVYYALGGKYLSFIDYLSKNIIIFLIFVTVAFVVGYLCERSIVLINFKIFKMQIKIFKSKINMNVINYLLTIEFVRKNLEDAFKTLETVRLNRTITRIIASAFLINAVIFLVVFILNHNLVDLILFVGFLLFAVVSIVSFRKSDMIFGTMLRLLNKERIRIQAQTVGRE